MSDRLCLLSIHAHPDDEASKGACTVAKYDAEGVHTVLVCATGGEVGDILNPAMDRPEIRDNLPEVRRQELANAAEVIGYREVIELGQPKHRVAAECGTGPEVLSRTFKRLEEDGIIETGATTVTVLDPERLADLAEWLGT